MAVERSARNRWRLGVGSALATVGAAGIVFAVLADPSYSHGPLAFPIGFVHGLATALGAALALWNLKPS